MAEIRIEGQVFTLGDDIAADDAKLRATLVAVSPIAATCEILRAREGDKLVVTLVKKAGTKGGGVDVLVDALRSTPTHLLAVFAIAELTSPAALAAGDSPTQDAIEQAVAGARSEATAIRAVVHKLAAAPATAARATPTGF
ncbi:MAG: hypothetical protein IT175_07175 [Acidobacteria bacterium]|nr:hypothetical protein [Acidobacteriota bacterium]